MTRIFWDTFFLISGTFSMSVVFNGSLFTFSAGQSHPTVIDASVSTAASNGRNGDDATIATASDLPEAQNSIFTLGTGQSDTAIVDANFPFDSNSIAAPDTSGNSDDAAIATATNLPAAQSTFGMSVVFNDSLSTPGTDASISTDSNSTAAPNTSMSSSAATTNATSTSKDPPVKKFVAAAVRSHFDDCPDSHRHFCFHGTCRFLILEESPACVCHEGFMGLRCEHADLLAVVATNHRQQTVATVMVLCVIGSVLVMVLCTILHCWWRQDCRRRSHIHHYVPEKSSNVLKHGASYCPSESVV